MVVDFDITLDFLGNYPADERYSSLTGLQKFDLRSQRRRNIPDNIIA
jgi:hypothetical protein